MRAYAVVLVAVLAACGGDDGDGPGTVSDVPRDRVAETVSKTICRLWTVECDCARNFLGTYDNCVTNSTTYLEEQFAAAEAAGLSYDSECAAQVVNDYNQVIACNRLSDVTEDPTRLVNRPYCKVFFGTAQEGEACESHAVALGDSCAQGLQCLGSCFAQQPPRVRKLEGEACSNETDVCENGTLCVPEDLGNPEPGATICVRQPGDGETCLLGCDVGYYCDTEDQTCKAPPGLDASCAPITTTAPRCAMGFYCDDETEVCLTATAEGQVCDTDNECGAYMECIEQGDDSDQSLCGPEQALVCI